MPNMHIRVVLTACSLSLWALGIAWILIARVEGLRAPGELAARDLLLIIAALIPVACFIVLARLDSKISAATIAAMVATSVLVATIALRITTASSLLPALHAPGAMATAAFLVGPPALVFIAVYLMAVLWRRLVRHTADFE
jgi:hypothetical protein